MVANRMPIHMAGPVVPAAACPANVSQRKAPGAMSAMAFIVNPVRSKVCFISLVFSAIGNLLCMSCAEQSRTGSSKSGQRLQQQGHRTQHSENAEQWFSIQKQQT